MPFRHEPLKEEKSEPLRPYLDALTSALPGPEAAEWRQEAGQHLAAMAAAYEELGHAPEEAARLAAARFGDPGEIGRRMLGESRKARWQSFTRGVAEATATFVGPPALCFALLGILTAAYGYVGNDGYLAALRTEGQVMLYAAPLLSGAWMGRRARGPLRPLVTGAALFASFWMCLAYVIFFRCVVDAMAAPSLPEALRAMPAWLALTAAGALVSRAGARHRRRSNA